MRPKTGGRVLTHTPEEKLSGTVKKRAITLKKVRTMHPQEKNDEKLLDFSHFIKSYFNWFEIDKSNHEIIRNLSLWANRKPSFNGAKDGWHIDRGIFLIGNPGTGKDAIFRLLNQYLKYIGSSYRFAHKVVWQFSGEFMNEKIGYSCFGEEGKCNKYYEELCLTDPISGLPNKEYVSHFGNKVLIGAELIHILYNSFRQNGFQFHFSSNESIEKLEKIYGERCMSRLFEMCNIMEMFGKDRRKSNKSPIFISNRNQPAPPPPPKEVSQEEHVNNKELLEECYQKFLETNELPLGPAFIYQVLWSYDVQMHTEEEMRGYMKDVGDNYQQPMELVSKGEQAKEKAKVDYIWRYAREKAVFVYFQRLREHGCRSIFKEREVSIDTQNLLPKA